MPVSLKRRLILICVLCQVSFLLAFLSIGIYYTRKRMLTALDLSLQGRAMSVASLMRYENNANENLYFDNSLMPPSIEPDHPDIYAVWLKASENPIRSENWPPGLEISSAQRHHFDFKWGGVRYHGLRISEIPVLDRRPDSSPPTKTLTIIYAAPKNRLYKQMRNTGIVGAGLGLVLICLTAALLNWAIDRALPPSSVVV
jgi:hypothetical protein